MSAMMLFETKVPGKWVLSGEHAVLRGATAVALPHPEFSLSLKFDDRATDGFRIDQTFLSPELSVLLEGWIHEIFDQHSEKIPSGLLTIQSTIPMGAGLGSSAALCVGLARWM